MSEELIELIENATASPEYYAAVNASLLVQMRYLGEGFEGDALRIPMGEAESRIVGDRLYQLAWDDYLLHVEADHRGPEHGIDAWVGPRENPQPKWLVEDVTIERVADDG